MEQLNAKLEQLMEQIARSQKLKAMVTDLKDQRNTLARDVQALKEQTYKEELEVERLEEFSLSRLFYLLTGQLDEMLDKEEAEACAAALKYDTKRKELQAAEEELAKKEQELAALANCEEEYAAVLVEKTRRLKTMNSFYADRICTLEEGIARLKAEEKELREALNAADRATGTVESVLRSLSSAENWSTFDLLGGGMVSDIAKHSHLDKAQREINALQYALGRLRTELADVAIQTDVRIQVDGFLRFADYFFDGLFADWAVRERIQSARSQVIQVGSTVDSVRRQLESKLQLCRRQRENTYAELTELVKNA